MSKLKFLFDEEEDEKELFGWKQRTRGIGELPEYEIPKSTKLKFTGDIGVGAKAEGELTLPEKTKPELFQDPKMIELQKVNFKVLQQWLKELKESKDKWAFLKGETYSPELIELKKQYNKLAPHMYRKSEQWIQATALAAYGVGLAGELIPLVAKATPEMLRSILYKTEIKDVGKKELHTALYNVAKGTDTPAQRKIFDAFIKAKELGVPFAERLRGVKIPTVEPRFAFGAGKLSAMPTPDLVKAIVNYGGIPVDMAKEIVNIDPAKAIQVYQMLLNTSPALASEFLKAVEKPPITKEEEYAEKYDIPLEKVKVTELPKADVTKETVSEGTVKKLEELVSKGTTPEEVLKKVKKAVEPKEELKAEGKEPVELKVGDKVQFKRFYADITKGHEAEITKKYTTPKGETLLNLYFGSNLTGQKITRKGVPLDIVEISKTEPKLPTIKQPKKPVYQAQPATEVEKEEIPKVEPKLITKDQYNELKNYYQSDKTNEFPPHQMLTSGATYGKIKYQKYEYLTDDFLSQLTDKYKEIIETEPTEEYKKVVPTTIAEAKEILKVDPKKPLVSKDMLAKKMVEKKVSLSDIEAVKGEKIDVKKPKDIIIALRDIKAVKKEAVAEPTPKAVPKELEGLAEITAEEFELHTPKGYKYIHEIRGETAFVDSDKKIVVTDKFFELKPEDRKSVIAHEKGHLVIDEFTEKHPQMIFELAESELFGKINEKTGKFEGLFGHNKVEEILSDMVADINLGTSKETIKEQNLIVQYDIVKQIIKGEKPIMPPTPTEKVAEVEVKPPIPPSPPTTQQKAEEPINPIAKLNELIKQAKPRRGKLETEYTKERARRIAEVEKFINEKIDKVGGQEGYRIVLSKLKGQLAKPGAKATFEPIEDKLSETELKNLYLRTWKHPYLEEWEKVSAANELTNLLEGELPTPKGLVLLEEIYGTDLIKNILSKRALGLKVADVLIDVMNIPRALLATADMSAFLRQGIVYVISHPVISAKAMGKTFKFAFNSKSFEQYFKDLPKDKLYPLMRKSGLAITDPSRVLASGREEAFISRLMQQTPIIGQIIKFAERAYVGFLNKLRVDVFKTFADEFLSKGYSPVKDKDLFKATAEVVNTFTGRGSLGSLNRITPQLNTIFFSPRLIMARFNALNALWYIKQPKVIRIKALGDFAKFVAAGLTLLAIIKASGLGDVETDPRSSDFGKIRIGNTRWDIWGGFQQWCRVFAQFVTGKRKSTTTGEIISLSKDEYPFTTRKEVALRFIEGKLAPVPALVNELISGAKTFEGEDISLRTVAREKFIPMYIQDITEAYMDGGLGRAVGAGTTAFFGVGVQTWGPRKKPLKVTVPKDGKLKFEDKLDIKSTKLKFTF